VKVKKEIITMGMSDIKPEDETGTHMSAEDLKAWLDQGKDFTLLDVRNQFEIDYGTFDQAVDLKIKNFRSFPDALDQSSGLEKAKPVVMFCTGGVRCEKASALMLKKGFKEVYQLDGGIIRYFDQYGAAHYRGDCFVFDERETVAAA